MTTTQTTTGQTTWVLAGKAHKAHANRFGWVLECSGRTVGFAMPLGAELDDGDEACKRCSAK